MPEVEALRILPTCLCVNIDKHKKPNTRESGGENSLLVCMVCHTLCTNCRSKCSHVNASGTTTADYFSHRLDHGK